MNIEKRFRTNGWCDCLQERIACLQDIKDEFHLHCNGSLLADETCVNELPSDVLELIVPLLGGKLMQKTEYFIRK